MGSEPPPQNPSGYENNPLSDQPEFNVQEQAVLPYLLQGKRDSEIATVLDGNLRTIEGHSRKILSKYGVETRAGAVAAYYEIEMAKLRRDLDIVRAENAKMKLLITQIRRILERS